MKSAFRSIFVVNRTSLIGTAVIVALAAALITATGTWLEAGIQNEKFALIVRLGSSFAGLVVMITVFVVSSVFSGALRQRRREFALLRAIGATARQVRATITAEALAILLIAAPVGATLGILVAPFLVPLLRSSVDLPAGYTLPFSPIALGATLLVLLPTALLAALTAARGIVRVSPTVAVRESTVESPTTSRVRLRTAAALAITGITAAMTPFFIPGMIGSASGAMSAILLIIAAALAGPALIHRVSTRGMALVRNSTGAGRVLAFANSRGFSRRLSAAVIPLALLIALGSVQSGVNMAVARATANEVHAGVHADLIVQSHFGVTSTQLADIAALPGVTATMAEGQVSAAVRTDPEDGWDQATISTISPGSTAARGKPLLDPAVSSGSVRNLATTGTIAVSRDALLFTGKGIGGVIDVRLPGNKAMPAKIVAVYDRSLGFGDYIMGTDMRGATTTVFDTVFIDAASSSKPLVRRAIASMGLTVLDIAGYVRAATQGSGGEQQLSLVLLLALLGFVAAAAANTLAMSTASRRDEFVLLQRIGATRAQLMKMMMIETAIIIVTAVAIGILAVVPALVGVGQRMLGVPVPVFDVPMTSTLTVSTIVIAILTVIPTAWRGTSALSSRCRRQGRRD